MYALVHVFERILDNSWSVLKKNSKVMFSFTKSRSRLRVENFRSRSRPKNRPAPKPCIVSKFYLAWSRMYLVHGYWLGHVFPDGDLVFSLFTFCPQLVSNLATELVSSRPAALSGATARHQERPAGGRGGGCTVPLLHPRCWCATSQWPGPT